MSSFASAVLKPQESITLSKSQLIKDDEELQSIMSSLSKKSNECIKNKLTEVELFFLDHHSELIYDMYRHFSEIYKDRGLMNKIDYNGFLELFLSNIKITKIYDEWENIEYDESVL